MANNRTKKIIIWVIIVLFLLSSALTSMVYLFGNNSQIPEVQIDQNNLENYVDTSTTDVIIEGDINVDNPSQNDVQVVVTENEDKTEMDQTIEVDIGNGETDTPTVGDLNDSLQLSQ